MGETNSPSIAHVGYDISPLSGVKLKILTTRLTRNIVTHGQLKDNLYVKVSISTILIFGFGIFPTVWSFCSSLLAPW
jgi:hypothetical protein